MSVQPTTDPACSSCPATPSIATIIDARPRDLGGFKVGRLLPSTARRLVGPFIFFDHMGPAELGRGEGMDVRPHPHIGLATVTYLFEGEIIHRDNLGSHQPIRPGDINWMTRGPRNRALRANEPRFANDGFQDRWAAALGGSPARRRRDGSGVPPSPRGHVAGTRTRGHTHPRARWMPGCTLLVPRDHEERAAYVIKGAIDCGAEHAAPGRMLVFTPGAEVALRAESDSRVVLVGGAPIEGKRHIWWNFVSSSKERIEQAKRDWKERRFLKVPGDDVEFTPLPE